MRFRIGAFLLVAFACCIARDASAQVSREDGVRSVAGMLSAEQPYNDFTFRSSGGEILFADVDGDIYQIRGRPDHEEPHLPGGGEGCADEGGAGGFCLQVLNSDNQLECWADRPRRPGWQRDPRLACPLEATDGAPETYILRVSPRGEGDQACDTITPAPLLSEDAKLPYVLNVSLRPYAGKGSMRRGAARSTNKFRTGRSFGQRSP